MDNDLRNETLVNNGTASNTGGNTSTVSGGQSTNPTPAPSTATLDFADPGKKRRAEIEKMKAKLQRDIARDNIAIRKERNGQLFVWGAMVEGVYRDGNPQEREQLRQWAKRKLTDHRHLKRAECGSPVSRTRRRR